MSKRNTLAGKKARRDNRIARLNQTGIYHPIAGVQSAAPRQGKTNKYAPRRNTPKSEREKVAPNERIELQRMKDYNFHAKYGGESALEAGLGHAPRLRKGAKR